MKKNTAYSDFFIAQELVYAPCGLTIKHFEKKVESQEYTASSFQINNRHIRFRVAKITPTKTGQFVTFWKRIGTGPIMPYDISDQFDLLVISVRNIDHFGQFAFPKSILHKYGLLSKDGLGGKRAMRVYPPWDKTYNKQAQKTQTWQTLYFFEINESQPVDLALIRKLFSQ